MIFTMVSPFLNINAFIKQTFVPRFWWCGGALGSTNRTLGMAHVETASCNSWFRTESLKIPFYIQFQYDLYILDFYGYLEQEVEGTTVQDFLQHLLQSEIVNSGILEGLKTKAVREKREPRDIRINMELRHKQVKI